MTALFRYFITILFIQLTSFWASCSVARKGDGEAVKQEQTRANIQGQEIERVGIDDLNPRLKITSDNRIIVKKEYNLTGRNLVLNEGYTLDFQGGSFKNGYITGNKTKILYKGKVVFDKVGIRGTWIVENITTDMFKDLNYEQSLADVLALTNPQVMNRVLIKDYGYYYTVDVTRTGMFDAPLKLKSNTDLQLDGMIKLLPTNLFQYVILIVNQCNNVKVHGKGSIIGDKDIHDYSIDEKHNAWKSHEWGHGIRVSNSHDIEISGISVNKCTGDSYNIIDNSHKILLKGINADGSRRQGVTIGVASNVTIKDCQFLNIGKGNGTSPGSAIDIEPNNTECEIRNVIIDGCKIKNCRQGIISWSYGYGNTWTNNVKGEKKEHRDGRHYVNITITNCEIDGTEYAFSLYGWDKAEIRRCKVKNSVYFTKYPKNTLFTDNEINCDYLMHNWAKISNCTIRGNRMNIRKKTMIRLNDSKFDTNMNLGEHVNVQVFN